MALALGPVLVVIVRILQPVLWTMNAMGNGILRLFKVTPENEVTSAFTRDEVAGLVGGPARAGCWITGAIGCCSGR
jgi:CBS domain containing-hemolysin-like protein